MMEVIHGSKSITAFAPATVANVACGFDILGFAVEKPGDRVEMSLTASEGVTIEAITGDGGVLPKDAERNTAGVAVRKFLESLALRKIPSTGVALTLHKSMPLGSGMGSSAASSVAALVAVNALFGLPLTKLELLSLAIEGERVACGAAHADNVAPALFGGFVLIRSAEPLDVIPLDTPPDLFCTLVHPHIEVRTEDARSILKREVTLAKAIRQWGNTAALVAGLLKSDYALIARSLVDEIIEPVRKILIPGFDAVKSAALHAGALGCSISGSGPSLFALSTSERTAQRVGETMQQAFLDSVNFASDVFVSPINKHGATLL